MEFKGTKGAWKIKHSESKTAFNIVGTRIGGLYKIARIPYLVLDKMEKVTAENKAEAEANAKLIAASPILLDSLINIVAQFKKIDKLYSKDKQLIEFAEDAIKKATE